MDDKINLAGRGGTIFTNATQIPYQYKYQGQELQDELGLNLYDYHARNYDPAIGRWNVIDPMAPKYFSHSPYAYTLNNPVYFIDPTGMMVEMGDQLENGDPTGMTVEPPVGFNGEVFTDETGHYTKFGGLDYSYVKDGDTSKVFDSNDQFYYYTAEIIGEGRDNGLVATALRAYEKNYDPRLSPYNPDGFSITANLHFNALFGHGGGSLSFVMAPGQFGFVWDGYGGWGPSTTLGVSGGLDMGVLDLYGGANSLEDALAGPSSSWGGQVGPFGANYSTTTRPDGTIAPQGVRQYNVNVLGWGLKGGKLGNTSVGVGRGFHKSGSKFFKF